MNEALTQGRKSLAELDDPVEKIKRIVLAHLDGLGRDRDLAIVFQVELRSSTKFMEQFSATKVTDYLELIRGVIEDGQNRGVFRGRLNSQCRKSSLAPRRMAPLGAESNAKPALLLTVTMPLNGLAILAAQ